MPNVVKRTAVEDYKLTNEQRAFYKVFRKVNTVQKVLEKGLVAEQSKLAQMMQVYKDVSEKKKELLLQAPDQSTFESADEGMVESGRGGGAGMGRIPTDQSGVGGGL